TLPRSVLFAPHIPVVRILQIGLVGVVEAYRNKGCAVRIDQPPAVAGMLGAKESGCVELQVGVSTVGVEFCAHWASLFLEFLLAAFFMEDGVVLIRRPNLHRW